MNKPRPLMVLMPLSGARTLKRETMNLIRQLDDLFAQAEVPFLPVDCAGFDQAQARDELLAYFRANSTFEDALFLDSDINVDPRVVVLMATLEEPLLVCPYEMRDVPGGMGLEGWAVDMAGESVNAEVREGKQMMRVRGAGLGCVRVRRQALEQMHIFNDEGHDGGGWSAVPVAAPEWISHYPAWNGLLCTGFCTPIVHEHPDGSGVMRRRPEDMSFFARARAAGVDAYALLDAPIWHDARGGRTMLDAILDQERNLAALKKRMSAELAVYPDTMLGLVDVLDGAYDIHGLSFDTPPTILDIGANVGAFSVWAVKRFPGAQIVAYEPHPEMAMMYTENMRGREARRVAVVGKPLSSPTIFLADGPHNPGERTVRPVKGTHLETGLEVPWIAAKDLPPCDVLKIDAEGVEPEILANYPHLMKCTAVMLEWHSALHYRQIREFMMARGFHCLVDRSRGDSKRPRELCFVRRGVELQGAIDAGSR